MTTRRWQRPSWFALVLTVAGVISFARLGLWQLERAEEARGLEATFAAAAAAPERTLESLGERLAAQSWPRVRVRGHFVADRGYLRDEQVRHGTLGIEAYAVFALDPGQAADPASVVLVDRGWIAATVAARATQPLPALPTGDVALAGIYAPFPGSGLRMGGNALPAQATWPKLTLAIEHAEIAADLGQPLLPRVLLLDADAASGFARGWTPTAMPPERHLGYAVQWFAFALAAVAIFVLLHFRRPR
ncbi:MAG: SURF1 family protein [Rudaea sp.]